MLPRPSEDAPDDDAAADLRALGVADDEIDAYLVEDGEDEPEESLYEVRPENWETVQVFQALGSQWRRNPLNGNFDGLLYTSMESAMRMMKIDDTAAVFAGLRVMEAAALRELNRGR